MFSFPLYLGHIQTVQTECSSPTLMLIGFCDALFFCAGLLLAKSLFQQSVSKTRVVFFIFSLLLNFVVVTYFGGASSWLG